MSKYHAVASVDTGLMRKLDGIYSIENFILKPCLKTEERKHREFSTFVLEFDFELLDNNKSTNDSIDFFDDVVYDKGIEIAKEFAAWISLATGKWTRLSSKSFGPTMGFGPYHCSKVEDYNDNVLDTIFHVDKKAKKGDFYNIQRPSLSSNRYENLSGVLKLPSDFPSLTKKLYSLKEEESDKFLNACFSYQFALDVWISYPTVSLLSLVSAVESIMSNVKETARKKFKLFFEQNLKSPLPEDFRKFLDNMYSKRSSYAHTALLGMDNMRGIQFRNIPIYKEKQKFNYEREILEKIVNATLIEWLKK